MAKRRKYTVEQLKEAVKSSTSVRQTLLKLNMCETGSAYPTCKKYIKEFGLDTSHFTGQGWSKGKTYAPRKPIQSYLVKACGTKSITSNELKKRLIHSGILEHKCYNCGLTSWLGEPIPIELEHKDGDRENNEIDNLTILCPNCHSLTPTHAGKNIGRKSGTKDYKLELWECLGVKSNVFRLVSGGNHVELLTPKSVSKRPPKEVLEHLVWQESTVKIAKLFQVSDKAVEKWCKSYGIPKPPRGYWAKMKSQTRKISHRPHLGGIKCKV